MRTSLDCLVCFIRQARSTGKLATDDPTVQRRIIDEAGRFLATVDPERTPPENAVSLYAMMAAELQIDDPFARVKQESNTFALGIREDMGARIENESDPLRAAIRVAIGGNIIDYAAQHVFDVEETMNTCLTREFVLDDYPLLRETLQDAGAGVKLLYLCDNCGEIVFDTLLIQRLQQLGCQVTAAVRKHPIINDATMEDARICGLDQICPVITNGTGCPGTPLADCSSEFLQHFRAADIIISKGMGNYETLSEEAAPIFFLFTVKCGQVACHVSTRKQLASGILTGSGEMILMRQTVET